MKSIKPSVKPKLVSKIRRTKVQAYGTRMQWSEMVAAVKRRDGHKCRICGTTENLQVDHIIPVSKGGRTILPNLWTLCAYHHSQRPGHKQAKGLILSSVK